MDIIAQFENFLRHASEKSLTEESTRTQLSRIDSLLRMIVEATGLIHDSQASFTRFESEGRTDAGVRQNQLIRLLEVEAFLAEKAPQAGAQSLSGLKENILQERLRWQAAKPSVATPPEEKDEIQEQEPETSFGWRKGTAKQKATSRDDEASAKNPTYADRFKKREEKKKRLEKKASLIEEIKSAALQSDKEGRSNDLTLDPGELYETAKAEASLYGRGSLKWACAILNISTSETLETARENYLYRAKVWHPDVHSHTSAKMFTEAMADLTESWAVARKKLSRR